MGKLQIDLMLQTVVYMITSASRVKSDPRGANTTVSTQWDPLTTQCHAFNGTKPNTASLRLK
jgi:hypothetical protein